MNEMINQKLHAMGAFLVALRKDLVDSIRAAASYESLLLGTAVLAVFMAAVGYFFGVTITPLYFYFAVSLGLLVAFVSHPSMALKYFLTVGVALLLTAYTFSYVGYDSLTYHFPMQSLLRNGWNPVFESTYEKLEPLLEGMKYARTHTLFLLKFTETVGAIVSSASGLFTGDSFLGYILLFALFSYSFKFAGRYWGAAGWKAVVFAAGITF